MNYDIEQADLLTAKLKDITAKTRNRGGRSALRAAATVFKKNVIKRVKQIDDPATPEDISKNVYVQFASRSSKRTGDVMFRVGILGGAKQRVKNRKNDAAGLTGKTYNVGGDKSNPGGDTFYWRFLEFGTINRSATPFMRPAIEESRSKALEVFSQKMNKFLDKEARSSL